MGCVVNVASSLWLWLNSRRLSHQFPQQKIHHRCRQRCGTRYGSCRSPGHQHLLLWWPPLCVPQECPQLGCDFHTAKTQIEKHEEKQQNSERDKSLVVHPLTSFCSNRGFSLLTSMTLMMTLHSVWKSVRQKTKELRVKTWDSLLFTGELHHQHHVYYIIIITSCSIRVTWVADFDFKVEHLPVFSPQHAQRLNSSRSFINGEGKGRSVWILGNDGVRQLSIQCSLLIIVMGHQITYLAAWNKKEPQCKKLSSYTSPYSLLRLNPKVEHWSAESVSAQV